ncbi:hypothetical protein EDD37DRAFT_110839 [Exophiala viscosa]|uniref:uncharacterized protein n=1 Tax=Exophiala viscosa TaxID=2486360 RepID=UPI002193C569|nr:hypothetical protein EDD37DRAFT_110839 [Exophiala viscosa]
MTVLPHKSHNEDGTLRKSQLRSRQNGPPTGEGDGSDGSDGGGGGSSGFSGSAVIIGIVVAVVFVITASILLYSFLRKWKLQGKNPRYIPTKFLKQKWQAWNPGGKYSAVRNRDLSSSNTAYTGNNIQAGTGVDRNTSVRSVITLPAYSRTPKESEEVIGREGERAGMDTVVEFPETVDEQEAQREDQMESLYQIRVARRRELAEREERRRERREARERGDNARLEELRRESRQRASESAVSLNAVADVSAATLIAEHQSRGRESRVSSVAYGSLGQVRHDGTRLRANSNESERGGLLSGAAPMGETAGRPRQYSDATSIGNLSQPRTRERSISDLSVSTNGSDLIRQITPGSTVMDDAARPRSSHSEGQSGTSNSSPTANRYTPAESTGSEDVGESRIPPLDVAGGSHPPAYEVSEWGDAPSYEAAVARAASNAAARASGEPTRVSSSAPRLPQLNLPMISVSGASEPNTPILGSEDRSPSLPKATSSSSEITADLPGGFPS